MHRHTSSLHESSLHVEHLLCQETQPSCHSSFEDLCTSQPLEWSEPWSPFDVQGKGSFVCCHCLAFIRSFGENTEKGVEQTRDLEECFVSW